MQGVLDLGDVGVYLVVEGAVRSVYLGKELVYDATRHSELISLGGGGGVFGGCF